MTVPICGYHILMILSAVDNHFHHAEDAVIRDFIIMHYPACEELEEQLAIISNLLPAEWEAHFKQVEKKFFTLASKKEQKTLMNFAINLVKADEKVTIDEHHYMREFVRKYKIAQALDARKN
jgi:hypothetical protein